MLLQRAIYPRGSWRGMISEMDRIRQEMDRVMNSAYGGDYPEHSGAGVFPALNISEDEERFVVKAELAGLKPEEIDISITGKTLSIKGERKPPEVEEKARYHRRERGFHKFSRAVTLPAMVQADKVTAKNTNGVLTIWLPKLEEVKPRQITVTAS